MVARSRVWAEDRVLDVPRLIHREGRREREEKKGNEEKPRVCHSEQSEESTSS